MEEVKEKKEFKNTIFGICLEAILILFIGTLITLPLQIGMMVIKNKEIAFILQYTIFLGPFLALILRLWKCKDFDILKKMSIKNNRLLIGSIIGLLLGLLMNTFCVYMAYKNGNVSLTYIGASIPLLIFAFVSITIQSTTEELICRLFIYEKLKKYYKSPLIWIIVNSLLFGALHLLNPGITLLSITNIIIFGILMSCLIYYFDNIWVVVALHTAWNFCQNIIFGLPNSGAESELSIYKLTQSSNSFYYNTSFGIEGTLLAILVLSIVTIIICLIGKYTKNK